MSINRISFEGNWKPFEGKPRRVYGRLEIGEGKIVLETKTPLRKGAAGFKQAIDGPPAINAIITGRAGDSVITLTGCTYGGYDTRAGTLTTRIRALNAFVGGTSRNRFSFVGCRVTFTHLHDWTRRSSIRHTLTKDDRPAISVESPGELSFKLNDFVTWAIVPGWSIEDKPPGMVIGDEETLDFRFASGLDIDIIVGSYVEPMRRLLSLLTGERVRVVEIHLDQGGKTRVGDFAVQLFQKRRNPEIPQHDSLFWTYLDSIKPDIEAVAKKWFDLQAHLESVLGLYFAVRESSDLYLSQRFLFLAQATEVYQQYSPQFQPFVLSSPCFKSKVANIIAAVPEESKDWLREKLHYANRKTFGEKLAELMHSHHDEMKLLVSDAKAFCAKVRDTRNYHTHYDEELRRKGRVAEGPELAELADRLEALLTLSFADEIGLKQKIAPRVILLYRNRKWTSSKRVVKG